MRAPGSQAKTCRAHGLHDRKIGAQGLIASLQSSPSSSAKILGFQGSKEPAFGTLRSCQCTTNMLPSETLLIFQKKAKNSKANLLPLELNISIKQHHYKSVL